MSNLIPTPRTDKHGRTVIRHMKPQAAAKNANIPHLMLKAPKDRDVLVAGITQTLSTAMTPLDLSMHPKAKIIKALTPFSNATLNKIQQCEWTSSKADAFTCGIRNSWDEARTNDYLAVSEALTKEEPDGIPVQHYSTWIEYPELHPANNEGDYPEERLSQLLAIYHVINDMFDQDEYADEWDEIDGGVEEPYLAPTPFRDLLLNPGPNYNREDITRIITTHHSYDPERIKAMLDFDVQPLIAGVI